MTTNDLIAEVSVALQAAVLAFDTDVDAIIVTEGDIRIIVDSEKDAEAVADALWERAEANTISPAEFRRCISGQAMFEGLFGTPPVVVSIIVSESAA